MYSSPAKSASGRASWWASIWANFAAISRPRATASSSAPIIRGSGSRLAVTGSVRGHYAVTFPSSAPAHYPFPKARASDKMKFEVGRSSNGKTAASGAAYRGSNPCLPANPLLRNVMRLLVMPLAALPLFLFAQDPPPAAAPPEVDQALRARAAQFGQYQMEGNFRKAYEMVAEDSQDFFFSAPKEKPQAYTIEDVRYADNFTKATVRVTSTRRMLVGSHLIDLPDVVLEQWRLEDGKWMWYHDPNSARATVIGPLAADGIVKPGALNPKALPPKDLTPEAMTAAAQ